MRGRGGCYYAMEEYDYTISVSHTWQTIRPVIAFKTHKIYTIKANSH